MIHIEEKRTVKLPGLTSLFVSFNYHPKYVEILKTVPVFNFDKNTKVWEVPITSLKSIVTALSKYDNIELHLLDYKEKDNKKYTLKKYKTKPYDYQEAGIQFGLNHDKWALLDAPGLGKAFTLDTCVLTPTGFVPISEIHPGQLVFDETGYTCKVTATYNHDCLDMYKIVFSDNTELTCCKDHLWQVIVDEKSETHSTMWILENYNEKEIFIPSVSPIQFHSMTKTPVIPARTFSTQINDDEEHEYTSEDKTIVIDKYQGAVIAANLFSSVEERKNITKSVLQIHSLRGTHNVIASRYTFKYFRYMIQSLGGFVKVEQIEGHIFRFSVHFQEKRKIVSVTYFGKAPGKCLTVDSPSRLYVVENFIVTHNTLQMTCLAEEIKKRDNISHCLVVCGVNTLKENWRREIEKHSSLSCMILGERITRTGNRVIGSVSERAAQLKKKIKEFFLITNIETLRSDEIIKALKSGKNKIDMIVLDEAHVIKDPASKQSRNLVKLSADYKVALTGTFLLNSPVDAYVPLKWLGVEKSNFSTFKSFYCLYGGAFGAEIIGYRNIPVLQQMLDKYSLRRTKDILNLPPKTIIEEVVEMNPAQQEFYDKIKEGIIEDVDKVHMSTANLLAMVTRLRQATALPSILTSERIESSKVARACDLAEQIISNNEKIVIFSTFKDTCYELAEKLKKYHPVICNGDISTDDINKNIVDFQNNPDVKVMIATHQKMGTGITLTAASTAIFIDLPWTDGNFCQACDRIHRIGTKKPVTIYCLINSGTIDERVMEIVKDKSAISGYVLDGEITEQGIESLRKYISELSV